MLQTFKAVPMHTLFLQGPDHALHYAALLRAVRRDEFLLQAIAPDQPCVGPAGKHQAIIRAQQERLRTRPSVPYQRLSGVAVDHQRHGQSAVPTTPDPTQVGRPALLWPGGHRGQRLNPQPVPDGALAYLPTLQLKNALHRVLVHLQQAGHCGVTKGRFLLNQCLIGAASACCTFGAELVTR